MFTHLHNHTEYSLLDGLSRIGAMVHRARDLGMNALAITDHGGLYGAIEFYTECREAGIKPIIGLETYVAQSSRHSKGAMDKSPYHLVLLAQNGEGYNNLLKLSSKSHLEGFYYKPRVDKELLKDHSNGLIALSGCLNAEIPRLVLDGKLDEARQAIEWYKETFTAFYLELQRHQDIPDLEKLNKVLIELSYETGVPVVATNDSHYIYQEDAPIQDILICIHTNTNIQDEKRLKMSDDSYYLKTSEEMEELFSDIPEAVANTQKIADLCEIEIDFSQMRLPEYTPPDSLTAAEYLEVLCEEGIRKHYGEPSAEVSKRLSYELDVISKTQFDNYMLVVWDIAAFARKSNILFGVRGSAAASLVLYCLGVTDIDPLQYRLVFERFLNLERREMPDIDMDFQDDRRDEVIAYVRRKYGGDHVAQIITFGTLGARAALRDTGRALGMAYSDVNRIANLVPSKVNSIEEALEANPELKEIYQSDASLKNLMDKARRLEGVARHASTHAAGLVISKEPLVESVPLQRPIKGDSEDMAMTQFPMEPIAKLGLLKMDLLGLTNLTIVEKARQMIIQRRGVSIDLSKIPLDDRRTFDLLSSGETTGVFQLESSGMRRYIQKLKPSSLGDVAAMIALYRPGPMEHIDTFIRAKHGEEPIRYPHSMLQDILEETYGVIVYQDQVLLIAQAFAGYSLGEADVVRKAMGKKIPEVMQHEGEKFIEGALSKGFTRELAEEVFQLIEPFAGYAFNKAHSVCYALIAYWTAYLKSNYPEEYMASVMNANAGQGEKISSAVTECLRLGVQVLLPDVNRSDSEFSVDIGADGKPAIRFGLASVKNVGYTAVEPLVRERKDNGPYTTIEDLCRRADLRSINRRAMESLMKVGGLDSVGHRGSLLASVERIMSLSQIEVGLRESGQANMFDLFGDDVPASVNLLTLEHGEVKQQERLAWEKELLGTFVSETPLSALAYNVPNNAVISRDSIDLDMVDQQLLIVGQVSSVRSLTTRDGKPFAAVVLDLLGGSVDVMVWPKVYQDTHELWLDGALLWIRGKVRLRYEEISIACDEVKPYVIPEIEADMISNEGLPSKGDTAEIIPVGNTGLDDDKAPMNGKNRVSTEKLWVSLEESNDPGKDEHLLREVMKLLMNHPGTSPVFLRIKTDGKLVTGELPSVSIEYWENLHEELVDIVGESGVHLEVLS